MGGGKADGKLRRVCFQARDSGRRSVGTLETEWGALSHPNPEATPHAQSCLQDTHPSSCRLGPAPPLTGVRREHPLGLQLGVLEPKGLRAAGSLRPPGHPCPLHPGGGRVQSPAEEALARHLPLPSRRMLRNTARAPGPGDFHSELKGRERNN